MTHNHIITLYHGHIKKILMGSTTVLAGYRLGQVVISAFDEIINS